MSQFTQAMPVIIHEDPSKPEYFSSLMVPVLEPQDTSAAGIRDDSTTSRRSGLSIDSISTTIPRVTRFTMDQIDSIFMISDRRQQEIDSARAEAQRTARRPEQISAPVHIDRDKVPYNLVDKDTQFSQSSHFMEGLKEKHYSL